MNAGSNTIPELIRLLYRIHFYMEGDNTGLYFPGLQPLKDYGPLQSQIRQAFSEENICMYITLVRSTFGNEVGLRPQICFYDTISGFTVPHDVATALSLQTQITFRLGYLGRVVYKDGSKDITDGLEKRPEVLLDIPFHSVVPKDTTGHRIVHELLHCVGMEEEQVTAIDWSIYLSHKETIGKFADEIKNGMPQIKNSFDQRCKRITENESWMLPKLRSIVSALVLGRKNDLNEKTYSCSVFSDDGHYSDIDVKVMFA